MGIEDAGLSRRGFLAGAAAATAGGILAASGYAATAFAADEAAVEEATVDAGAEAISANGKRIPKKFDIDMANVEAIEAIAEPETYDYETDILVIGYGNGGTNAALTGVLRGCNVIAMERSTRDNWCEHGGTVFPVIFGEPSWVEEMGFPDWSEDTIKEFVTSRTNEKLSKQDFEAAVNFYKNCPLAFQQIQDLGEGCAFFRNRGIDSWVKGPLFTPLNDNLSEGGSEIYPWVNKYFAVENVICKRSEEKGLQVLWGTPATNLIVDDSGAVVGARGVDAEGNVVYVRAKATIDCIGGFAANHDMIAYYGFTDDVCGCNVQGLNDDGAGMRMCQGAGSGVRGLPRMDCVADCGIDTLELGLPWNYIYQCPTITDKYVSSYIDPSIFIARQPHSLRVNKYGYRYVGEDASWADKVFYAAKQPEKHIFSIMDSNMREKFETIYVGERNGICEYPITEDRTIYFSDDDIRPLPDWEIGLEQSVEDGITVKADTLEELAEKLGINVENFLETVENYNAMCAAGEDTEYGKSVDYLYPIVDAPFYGMERKAGLVWVAPGGVPCDKNLHVLNEVGNVIPGLFAGANDAAMTNVTTGDPKCKPVLPIGAGYALTVGYMAANTAADEIEAGILSAEPVTIAASGEIDEVTAAGEAARSAVCTSCHAAPSRGNFASMNKEEIVDMFTTNHDGIKVDEEMAQLFAEFATE